MRNYPFRTGSPAAAGEIPLTGTAPITHGDDSPVPKVHATGGSRVAYHPVGSPPRPRRGESGEAGVGSALLIVAATLLATTG